MRFVDVDFVPSSFITKPSRRRSKRAAVATPIAAPAPPPVPVAQPTATPIAAPAPPPVPVAQPTAAPAPVASAPRTRIIYKNGSNNDQYNTANYKQQVFIALASALLITMVGDHFNRTTGKNAKNPLAYQGDKAKFVAAWLFLGVLLIAMASFRGTDKLAASFAWLILVASLLINGEAVFAAVAINNTSTPAATTAPTAK